MLRSDSGFLPGWLRAPHGALLTRFPTPTRRIRICAAGSEWLPCIQHSVHKVTSSGMGTCRFWSLQVMHLSKVTTLTGQKPAGSGRPKPSVCYCQVILMAFHPDQPTDKLIYILRIVPQNHIYHSSLKDTSLIWV